jgi:hypothetical protein
MTQWVTAFSAEHYASDLCILTSLRIKTIQRRLILCHYVIVIKSCLNNRTKECKTQNLCFSVNKTLFITLLNCLLVVLLFMTHDYFMDLEWLIDWLIDWVVALPFIMKRIRDTIQFHFLLVHWLSSLMTNWKISNNTQIWHITKQTEKKGNKTQDRIMNYSSFNL